MGVIGIELAVKVWPVREKQEASEEAASPGKKLSEELRLLRGSDQ